MDRNKLSRTRFGAAGLVAVLALAGCVGTNSMGSDDMGSAGPISAQLSGKTISNVDATLRLGSDGSLSGVVGGNSTEVTGAWVERDGQFCRTLTEPAPLADTRCQDVTFNPDGTVTFSDGVIGDVTYTIS